MDSHVGAVKEGRHDAQVREARAAKFFFFRLVFFFSGKRRGLTCCQVREARAARFFFRLVFFSSGTRRGLPCCQVREARAARFFLISFFFLGGRALQDSLHAVAGLIACTVVGFFTCTSRPLYTH